MGSEQPRQSSVPDIENPAPRKEVEVQLVRESGEISWQDSPWNYISNKKQFLSMACKGGIKPMKANIAFQVILGLQTADKINPAMFELLREKMSVQKKKTGKGTPDTLPDGWRTKKDTKTGACYYYNTNTKQT